MADGVWIFSKSLNTRIVLMQQDWFKWTIARISRLCYSILASYINSVFISHMEPFKMKKLFAALVCAIAMLPTVSSANIAYDTLTFTATSSAYTIDFSWIDATYPWGAEANGLYGTLLTDASAWSESGFKGLLSSSTSLSTFNDVPGLAAGSFSKTYSGLVLGDIYKVGIGGAWLAASGGKVSIDSFAPAVPEPETYAMLLAGLGLVGGLARRRSSRS
jgi:hypothetical protein